MLVSGAYAAAFWAAFSGGQTAVVPTLIISFIPVFIIVNAIVADYYREHYTGVGEYVFGAIMGLILDVGITAIAVFLLMVLVTLGSGGQ